MKNNTKFLWLYTSILFSVALILILFAGLTQQNYEKELETHETAKAGMQKSVAELSQTNMQLLQEKDALKKENDELKEAAETTNEQMHEMNSRIDVFNNLASALREYDLGNRKGARSMLADLDPSKLTQPQLYIYNRIMK